MEERLVSCDDHMDLQFIPADTWQKRLPAEMRERGPKVVDTPEGRFWSWEGKRGLSFGRKAGLIDIFARAGIPLEPEPGVYRPSSGKYRLEDMDRDGVEASVIYTFTPTIDDPELKAACLRVYNSWLAEEFCSVDPRRLVPLAYLPGHTVEAAVDELYRVARLGLRGAVLDAYASVKPPFDPTWEPLWSAVEETGLVMSFHIGGGLHSLSRDTSSWMAQAMTSVVHMQADELIAGMVFCGALERHPNFRLVLGETGIGWVPYVLEMMDFQQNEWTKLIAGPQIGMRASELFRRQMYVTFESERVGVKLIPEIGAGSVMWGSDFPHGIGTFPNSRQVVARMFAESDPAVTRRVVRENAAELYGIGVSK
jgi:predicted TIM-barrel fold metal-dependent hydrolase